MTRGLQARQLDVTAGRQRRFGEPSDSRGWSRRTGSAADDRSGFRHHTGMEHRVIEEFSRNHLATDLRETGLANPTNWKPIAVSTSLGMSSRQVITLLTTWQMRKSP